MLARLESIGQNIISDVVNEMIVGLLFGEIRLFIRGLASRGADHQSRMYEYAGSRWYVVVHSAGVGDPVANRYVCAPSYQQYGVASF